jgi:antitoxin component YwqK of YwqJK toxin-antitoxin module
MKRAILISFIILGLNLNAYEIKEIKTLDEISQELNSSSTKKINSQSKDNELIPLEKIDSNVKTEEKISKEETVNKVSQEKKNDLRVEDISKKVYGDDKLVYVKGENKPFTGKFALFLGEIIESSEEYQNGKLHGARIWYSDDGKIVMSENYNNDKLDGEQKAYYTNGQVKSIIRYKNNKIVGLEVYNQNGKTLHKEDLSNGTGVWKTFWDNGKVMEEGRYKNWVKDGTWKRYQEDGTVDSITVYEKGKQKSQTWN